MNNLKELILIDDSNEDLVEAMIRERRAAILADLQKDIEELKWKVSDEDDPYILGIIPQQIALQEKLDVVKKELSRLLQPIEK
jgi:hypothetical protein